MSNTELPGQAADTPAARSDGPPETGPLAVLPLRNMVLFPSIPTQLLVGREGSLQLVQEAAETGRAIAVVAQRSPEVEEPGPQDIHAVGVSAVIHRALKLPDGHLQILVRGLARVRVAEFVQQAPYLIARVDSVSEVALGTPQELALAHNLSQQFQKVVALSPAMGDDLQVTVVNLEKRPGQLADFVASAMDLPAAEKQELLEEASVQRRLERLTVALNRELSILEMGRQIQSQVQQEMGQAQREHILREQMRVIQKELGEGEANEVEELRQRILAARLPQEALQEAERELERLKGMSHGSAEQTVVRTYLDWMVSLPWGRTSRRSVDVGRAARILDEDHEGLEKVKERILEYISVRKLRRDARGPILCFVGPPGVGKTSLGRSIARALGRRFVRISLGGVHDEAEIRGHRRTYVGALPGRILQGLRKAGTNNPVFMLDEIDKVGADFRGDPAAALLEVLDPEQNFSFSDHYLDVSFDLSRVIFIATANQLETIPPALRDRMEVVYLSGYTEDEKVQIALRHLLPRQLKEHGLSRHRVSIPEESIRALVRGYTQEAGVRNLERELGRICRKVARRVVEGRRGSVSVGTGDLAGMLGPEKVLLTVGEEVRTPGIAVGLAWTPAGGEVMFVEATKMRGSKQLILTGKLGDVMKESAQIALSYTRARAADWGIDDSFFEEHDIHVHVPSGAVPKDGPSAGVTVVTALLSLLTGRPVRGDVAMTGEVTLRGRVLPVGGIKEKVLAAHRAGLMTVILPRRNEKDLDELPAPVRARMRFVLVDDLSEALDVSLKPAAARRAA
ncbi:MAG: endopeptidase La [Candidatus Latescibacterota bacterium]